MKTEIQARRFARWLGSGWTLSLTLVIFAAEAGWQALTSPFPMTYDESYHFGLIRFFVHHLDPIVTGQSPDTYRLGAIVQNPSFLYHYVMSFPYRFIELFTHDPETQLIALRLINVALALGGLFIMRRLLRALNVSDALSNLLVLIVALTPMFTVLSGQVNYDNLLIPATAACIYAAVLFLRGLDRKVFDTKAFLALLALCLFSSLIKFAFLPVFAAIAALSAWKIYVRRGRDMAALRSSARRSFTGMGRGIRLALLAACVAGGFLFVRIYGVNVVRYHNPAPQCNQVLSVDACRHYYSWNLNYRIKAYSAERHIQRVNVLRYDAYWLTVTAFEPYSTLTPFQGHIYAFAPFLVIIGLLGVIALICMALSMRKILRDRDLGPLAFICVFYIACLWARNYHDYLQLGWPRAIHGRYLLPILIILYLLLASGVRYTLGNLPAARAATAKAALALILVASFVYFGGFRQYVHYVYPIYGRISDRNDFALHDAYTGD